MFPKEYDWVTSVFYISFYIRSLVFVGRRLMSRIRDAVDRKVAITFKIYAGILDGVFGFYPLRVYHPLIY